MPEEKKINPQVLKEWISKHLRTADEFTRVRRYEEAIIEIEHVLEIDPKNNYARSFLERVKMMHKRAKQQETQQSGPAEISLEERMAVISQHLSIAEDFINKKDYKHALEEVARVYKIDPTNYYAQTYSERIDLLMLEGTIEKSKVVVTEIQPKAQDVPQPPSPERGSTPMYRELLKEAWFDGNVSEKEAMELAAMRELFGITPENHKHLEREIKIEAYLEALYIAGRDNVITDMEQKTLQMMRAKYSISPEEQALAESRYSLIKRSSKSRGTILIVDTDQNGLESLSKVLKQRGFTALLAQNVESAIQILATQIPNIILSELFFKNSQVDGVAFFKKLQENALLKQVPFIFISSLTDRKIIQAGLRLGVDHFITKPVDADLLLAIIDGKLQM
jgi:CheY-like chemotaxis protein/antitoxin component HigA of HigAB toxin-antitoxin module